MSTDCRWFSAHLEDFFCEKLEAADLQLASDHLKACLSCRNEVAGLQEVDTLIKQLLRHRTMKARAAAQAPRRSIGFQLGLAGAAAAMAVLAGVSIFHIAGETDRILPAIQTVLQNPISPEPGQIKREPLTPTVRAKPDAPDQTSRGGTSVSEPAIPANAPEFQVIDPAGYSTNLQDYRGRVLLLGVWSGDQPEAAENLQRLYQAFGTRHEVRILGVSNRNQDRMAGTTFPMVFNNGSRLLDARNSDYVIVDKEGIVQLRGSLTGNANLLIPKIRVKLDELGGR